MRRYASKAFAILTKDADYGHYIWASQALDLRARYEMYESDVRSVIKSKVIKHCESEVLHRFNEHITESRKLNLYASFKKVYKLESNLDYIQYFTVRCTFAKLRVCAHNLQMEAARFSSSKTPRDERFYPYCKSLNIFSVEDEIHFLLVPPF